MDQALERTGVFTPTMQSLLATGVESGHLAEMLLKLCDQSEEDARAAISRLGKLLPALVYFVVVIWVVSLIMSLIGGYLNAVNDALN